MANEHPFILEGKKYIGAPYVFGATGPKEFDCSGFVRRAVKDASGIELPRTSYQQFNAGVPVKDDELQTGDLLFWKNTGDHNDGITHVAIHYAATQFLGAQRSTGVAFADGSTDYWRSRYAGAKRLVNNKGQQLGDDPTTTNARPGDMIRVIADRVNYRAEANWDEGAVAGSAQKGEAFTVVARHDMGDRTDLYELRAGTFITTHPSYVEVVK